MSERDSQIPASINIIVLVCLIILFSQIILVIELSSSGAKILTAIEAQHTVSEQAE